MSKWIEQGIHALLHRGLHEVIHYATHELPKVIGEIGKTSNNLSSSNTYNQQIRQEQVEFERLRYQQDIEFKQLLDREQSERLILLRAIRRLTQSPYTYEEDFDNPPSVKEYYDTRSPFMYDSYRKKFEGATVEALKKVLRLKEEEREARLKEEREARLKAVITFTSFFSALILVIFGGSLIYNNFVSNIETTETTSSQTETGAK